MKLDKAGKDFIKGWEGERLTAYPDPVSGGDPWTIGYGSTKGVHKGMTITQAQADSRFDADIKWVEDAINKDVTAAITQNQFNAMADFCYNVGASAFSTSLVVKRLNNGDYRGAQEDFIHWDHAGGKVNSDLKRRRKAEAELFGKDII
jgi:lysozyme